MIETIDYLLQFVVLLICGAIAVARAAGTRSRGWLILAFFYACYALGDLYWTLCVALDGETPAASYISEMSWDAGFIFICLLLRLIRSDAAKRVWFAWLAPVFTFTAAVFFMQRGAYLDNLVCAAILGWMGYLVLQGLVADREKKSARMLRLSVGAFFLLEYAMWFISCFWMGDSLLNPYFWCDGLLTLVLASLIPGCQKTQKTQK